LPIFGLKFSRFQKFYLSQLCARKLIFEDNILEVLTAPKHISAEKRDHIRPSYSSAKLGRRTRFWRFFALLVHISAVYGPIWTFDMSIESS
jgi:hypothetical protein